MHDRASRSIQATTTHLMPLLTRLATAFPEHSQVSLLTTLRDTAIDFIRASRCLRTWVSVELYPDTIAYDIPLGCDYVLGTIYRVELNLECPKDGHHYKHHHRHHHRHHPEEDEHTHPWIQPSPSKLDCGDGGCGSFHDMQCHIQEYPNTQVLTAVNMIDRYHPQNYTYHMVDTDRIEIYPAPKHFMEQGLFIYLSYIPKPDVCEIPIEVADKYGSFIAAGALSRLYSNKAEDNYNLTSGSMYQSLYERGIVTAKSEAITGLAVTKRNTKQQHGSGAYYG